MNLVFTQPSGITPSCEANSYKKSSLVARYTVTKLLYELASSVFSVVQEDERYG